MGGFRVEGFLGTSMLRVCHVEGGFLGVAGPKGPKYLYGGTLPQTINLIPTAEP